MLRKRLLHPEICHCPLPEGAFMGSLPARAPIPAASLPALSSLPGASKALYLDFNGRTVERAFDELDSAFSKTSGNGSVSNVMAAGDQLYSKLRG